MLEIALRANLLYMHKLDRPKYLTFSSHVHKELTELYFDLLNRIVARVQNLLQNQEDDPEAHIPSLSLGDLYIT